MINSRLFGPLVRTFAFDLQRYGEAVKAADHEREEAVRRGCDPMTAAVKMAEALSYFDKKFSWPTPENCLDELASDLATKDPAYFRDELGAYRRARGTAEKRFPNLSRLAELWRVAPSAVENALRAMSVWEWQKLDEEQIKDPEKVSDLILAAVDEQRRREEEAQDRVAAGR